MRLPPNHMQYPGFWKYISNADPSVMLSCRFILVVLLLSVPMQDPLCFSAQSGKSLIPDPG